MVEQKRKGKQPYIPLYIGDWLQDTDCLSIDAEGAWLRVVFKCWKNNGVFTASEDVFARLCKVTPEKFASILLEWQQNDICDIHEEGNQHITVTCRRIKREKEISVIKAENGSKGGSKTQANIKAKTKQIPDNDIEYDNEIEIVNEIKESIKKEPLQNAPRGTSDESLFDVEQWTKDVLEGNDPMFLSMVRNQNMILNGQLDSLARDHLGKCARYNWHERMTTQQSFRLSLLNYITENLKIGKEKTNGKPKATLDEIRKFSK